MSMDVKPRFPKKRLDRIYFREIKTINTRILRGKFALVEVNLIFNNGSSKSLFFRPSGGGNFFSFPEENIPPEVLDFTNFINNLQQGITQWQ
ncbi:hypothetical protein AVMA1855_24710 [Acidovorax sp. SUPP1855]|uniref:hypothetical protein n=1 Tax=Acidovorax sp. SUPP1855 TaxID=431774 RepID=UPI0023DE3EA9|nr:hypothetical protein [Acidovorax sp. SUPP1855]GKS87416.1 hypothetical protein AVMA1855_24710 [Acidovorax sp. SUPP1855]